jgi:FAD binding domain.
VAVASAARNLIVVGQGAAGLAAALAATEAARAQGRPINVTLVDKAPEDEAGGNTRWSPSNMRMASPDRVEPSFVHDMLAATNFQGDESYFARLAKGGAGDGQVARIARHRIHSADLLSGERPTAHSAGRRRPGPHQGADESYQASWCGFSV